MTDELMTDESMGLHTVLRGGRDGCRNGVRHLLAVQGRKLLNGGFLFCSGPL